VQSDARAPVIAQLLANVPFDGYVAEKNITLDKSAFDEGAYSKATSLNWLHAYILLRQMLTI
jgi:hypothetical protein